MPLALHDASGVNFFAHLTHEPAFAALNGFHTNDLERALTMIPHLDHNTIPSVLDVLRRLFNGYLFQRRRDSLQSDSGCLLLAAPGRPRFCEPTSAND